MHPDIIDQVPPDRHERRRLEALERKSEAHDRRKFGWRVIEWSEAVGCSRSLTYELINQKQIDSVKLGNARVIVTHPQDFLASLREAI
jgi:hypothetical protein